MSEGDAHPHAVDSEEKAPDGAGEKGLAGRHRGSLTGLSPLLAALLSGCLLGLALPPRGLAWLAAIALVPLLRACRRASVPRGLGMGLLAGLAAGCIGMGIPHTAHELAGVSGAIGSLVVLLTLTAGGAAAMRCWPVQWWAVGVAALGVSAELVTFTRTPVHLALCLWRFPQLLQLAAITGAWGVSFLLWWVNAGAAASRIREARPLIGPALLGVLSLVIGTRLMAPLPKEYEGVALAAIQSGESGKHGMELLGRYARKQHVRIVVLPELAVGEYQTVNHDYRNALASTIRGYTIVGQVKRHAGQRYNTATIFSPRGRFVGTSSKIHLQGTERRQFRPAQHAEAMILPTGVIGIPVGADSCYTDVCWSLAVQGSNILCNPTNDPPSPGASLHVLHAAFYPLRSVENSVACVRADTHRMSLITDRFGRIIQIARVPGPAPILGTVDGEIRHTLYRRWGDWFAWACTFAALFFLAGSPLLASRAQQG